jgi:hypothetical protein
VDKSAIIGALSTKLPSGLAADLVEEFLAMRRDVQIGHLGGSAPGKFVETCVQVLQFLETGQYEPQPNVDKNLREMESRPSLLGDGLRICASRIARAMYALRNKRSISHKGEVDPNTYDLRLLHASAQWILAELIRTVTNVPMEQAGRLIDQVQAPVGGLIEDFGGKKLVLARMTAREEILILLHSHYPDFVPLADLMASADRRDKSTVRKVIKLLWEERLVQLAKNKGYKLTMAGLKAAIAVTGSAAPPE